MLSEILCFAENNKTELMTLLGVIIGGVIGFLGQIFAIKMNNAENLRKERTTTARTIYSQSDTLFNNISKINVIMIKLKGSDKDLEQFYKESDSALKEFDSYYTKNKIGIPMSSEKAVTGLQQSAIHLVLSVENAIGVMRQKDIEQEVLDVISTDWKKDFQEFKKLHRSASEILRRVLEGSIKK